jgi:nucleotide-binding universal stress UspA family protein
MSDVAQISRVLVGVDFDVASAAAVKMAASLASACGAELTASLIVLSIPVGKSDSQLSAITQALKECVHPVPFVPSSEGIVERSSS